MTALPGIRVLRRLALVLSALLLPLMPAQAETQISVGISFPGVSIGVNMPAYPNLVRVPGYPVYYAPQASSNYFFYDGLYWVYQDDGWYESSWYNGPWYRVMPEYVPLFILRVPVRYYRQPPPYFGGWRKDAPPQWGKHWGHDWEQRRPEWNRWDRRSAPAAAPLPTYQRRYSGDRYPEDGQRQESIRSEHYRYAPKETATQLQRQQRDTSGNQRGERPSEQPSARQDQRRQEPAQQRESDQRRSTQDRQRATDQQQRERDHQQPAQPTQQRARPDMPRSEAAPQGKGRERGDESRGQGNRADEQGKGRN